MMVIKGAKDIGRYIGMSIATFHRHKDKDSIPYYRAGRTIVARSEDLDKWMEKQMLEARGKQKAWFVQGVDADFATVVFADTKNEAKVIAMGTDACEGYDYIDLRTSRFAAMDEHYRGHKEMDWYDDEDRIALVKTGWQCWDPLPVECEGCCAREWCAVMEEDNE